MKFYSGYLMRLGAAVTVSVMFVGCTHIILKSSEIPILQTGSPLRGVSPKIFAFKDFRDVRGRDPYFMHPGHKLEQPAATVVAIAIRKELERNGHTCIVYSAQSKSDFIIEGSVYKFGVWEGATVAVKLTVTPVPPKEGFLTNTYEGGAPWRIGVSETKHLKQALLAMVKEMSTDPELIAFLEK